MVDTCLFLNESNLLEQDHSRFYRLVWSDDLPSFPFTKLRS